MPQLLTVCALFCLLLLPLSPAVAAEQKAVPPVPVEALTAAVNRLAAALEAEQKNASNKDSLEKLNLAIAYLSFRSRRIETLERDITTMKNSRTNLEEALKTWNERILALEEKQKQSPGGENEEFNRMIEDAKAQLTIFKERQSRVGEEIVQLENRNYELQREISVIEKFVERNLAF
jgi:predicted  nucleic acid-binding Zn-ribbon protein